MSKKFFLTSREKEILRLVAQGWTNLAIARYLGISPKTVDAHLHNVYRALGVSNRAQAVKYFLEHCPSSLKENS